MADLIKVFLLSMSPIGELRLAIPIGMAVYKLDTFLVFLTAVVGNLIPAIVVLLVFKKFSEFISSKSKIYTNLYNWWTNITLTKHSKKLEKYEFWGLAFFIGIPLPFTGAYAGALLAVLMNFSLKKSIPAVSLGVIISAIIVILLVLLGFNIEDYLDWQIILAAVLLSGAIWWYLKNRKKRRLKKLENAKNNE